LTAELDPAAARFRRSLRALRTRAVSELELVEDERSRLSRLIALIDEHEDGKPAPRRAPKRRRKRPRRAPSLLEVIEQRPGVRASMLAMVANREVDDVHAELNGLEREGRVERHGLGWRLVDAS
jgi:hypothetical protein